MRFGRIKHWAPVVLVVMSLLAFSGAGIPWAGAADDSAAEQSDSGSSTATADPNEEDTSEPEEQGSNEEVEVDEEAGQEVEEDPEPEQEDPKDPPPKKKKQIIGATAEILEKQSGLLFKARVDTGAKSCSLHVEEMEIVDEEEGWQENIGKVVRFKVSNGGKKTDWLDRRIDSYVIIKTSASRNRRYKVPLTLRWKGVEKKVLVTLNDRNGMDYPLLLGRNFLRGDFLVDVDINNDD